MADEDEYTISAASYPSDPELRDMKPRRFEKVFLSKRTDTDEKEEGK